MFLCTVIAVGMCFLFHFDRDGHEAAMPHSPLGDDMFGEMMNFARFSAQQRNFHAAGMVEMNLHGGDRQIVMMVMRLGKTIRELPHGMIVNIDERRDALGGAARFGGGEGEVSRCPPGKEAAAESETALIVICWLVSRCFWPTTFVDQPTRN